MVSLAAALLSCGGGGGSDGPTAPPPPTVDLNAVNAISITGPALVVGVGKTILLSAQATNANGTALQGQSFSWSSNPTSTATVEQNGTVLGVAPGTATVAAAIGGKNAQVTVTVTAAPPPATIAVNAGNGQSATINTPVGTSPSVIVKDAAGDPVAGVVVTFAVGPNSGNATGLSQLTNAAGIATVGSWTLGSSTGAQTLTATSGTLAGSPVTFTATAVALAANMRQYNTTSNNPCQNITLRTGRVEAETQHLTIVADVSNPANGFTAADYQAFASTFESLVWPVLTENFGVPADIDGGGRVVAFFTRAVNELTPAGSTSFVGGFFFARDLFPKVAAGRFQGCAGSNEAEMFYILAPDPTGSLGLAHSTAFVRNLAVGVIGHELQHLINSSRRLFINTTAEWPEKVFMEEGLSHIAEELLFYEASGVPPKSNVSAATIQSASSITAAANAYATSNLGRFSRYLKDPSDQSPYANNDVLETRGAAWSWLRYLADRGSASAVSGPDCSSTIALNVGATCRVESAGALNFDGGTGAEYTIVAFADGANFSADAAATNAVAITGPPTPSRMPSGASLSRIDGASGGPTLDLSFHGKLRRIEERELTSRVPSARARFAKPSRGLPRFSRAQAPERVSFNAAIVEPVWGRLLNSNLTGLPNVQAEFGANIRGATRDWAVANYVDDAVTVTQSQYAHPSWNFRSVMPLLSSNNSAYPLQVQSLTSSTNLNMVDGGATYYRLGLASGTSSTVTFAVIGAAASNLKLTVIRTK